MPVVGSNQQIIGVVTEFDILRAMQDGKELDRVKAEDIMSAPPLVVEEETPINEVLTLMANTVFSVSPWSRKEN